MDIVLVVRIIVKCSGRAVRLGKALYDFGLYVNAQRNGLGYTFGAADRHVKSNVNSLIGRVFVIVTVEFCNRRAPIGADFAGRTVRKHNVYGGKFGKACAYVVVIRFKVKYVERRRIAHKVVFIRNHAAVGKFSRNRQYYFAYLTVYQSKVELALDSTRAEILIPEFDFVVSALVVEAVGYIRQQTEVTVKRGCLIGDTRDNGFGLLGIVEDALLHGKNLIVTVVKNNYNGLRHGSKAVRRCSRRVDNQRSASDKVVIGVEIAVQRLHTVGI